MRMLMGLIVVSLLSLAAVAQEKVDKAKSPLLGEWYLVADMTTGGDLAAKLKENVTRVTIDAESITAGRTAGYKLDADKKQIDVTVDGGPKAEQGTYAGVYELSGDTLKIHLALPGEPRPTGFEAKGKTVLIVLNKGKKG